MNKTIFTFFPNGKTATSIKNEAKKLHKSGKFSTRSSALNHLSKEICNLSFNKAIKDAEGNSPVLFEEKVFLPFNYEEINFYIVAGKDSASINEEFEIKYPHNLKLENISYSTFEKTDNGWIVFLKKSEKEFIYLDIKKTDEGIVIDLQIEETLDRKHYESMCLDSTYAFWDEIFSIFEIFDNLTFNKDGKLSDFEAAIQLNHASEDDRTELARYKNMVLSLNGAIHIHYNESYYRGSEIKQLIKILIKDNVCTEKDFYQWLIYNDNSDKNPLNKTDIECMHNPWFDICYEDGNPISECFDEISTDILKEIIKFEL